MPLVVPSGLIFHVGYDSRRCVGSVCHVQKIRHLTSAAFGPLAAKYASRDFSKSRSFVIELFNLNSQVAPNQPLIRHAAPTSKWNASATVTRPKPSSL